MLPLQNDPNLRTIRTLIIHSIPVRIAERPYIPSRDRRRGIVDAYSGAVV